MPRPSHLDRPLALAALIVPLAACTAPRYEGAAHIHPQRPFISSDTETTQEKVLTAEGGFAIDPGETLELPIFLRYGLGAQTEMFVGTSPFKMVDHDDQQPDGSGWGDTYVGFRHRLRDKDMFSPAYGFQIQTKLPTGRPSSGLGTGATDWFVAAMATQTYYGFDTTAFYELGVLGEPSSTGVDHGHTLAMQTRRAMEGNFTAFAEVAFEWTPERDYDALTLMGGASLPLDSLTAVDFAVRIGAGSDAPAAAAPPVTVTEKMVSSSR